MKKGQITLFAVAGMMILLLFFFIVVVRVYFATEEAKEQIIQTEEIPSQIQNVENFVRRCIRSVTMDSLVILGRQAGYITVPELIRKDTTAYWHLDKANIQPTLNQIKIELEKQVDAELEKCLDFTTLEQENGLEITAEKPKSIITFEAQRTAIKVLIPMSVQREDFVKKYEDFGDVFDIPFRRMYELATQVNMRQLDAQFKFSSPIELVEQQSFEITYNIKEDSIVYTITDRTELEAGRHFSLSFASRLLNSELKRVVTVQANSRITPTVFPYIIYSVDNKAQLYVLPGTTSSINGKDVFDISVTQTYPEKIVREDVHTIETEDNDIITQDIEWKLTYPVYNFEPTGLRFNRPQRLVLFWDENRIPHKGNMGILYNDGEGWRPIPSAANYQENYVYSDVVGFSSYTPVDCELQSEKKIDVTSRLVPSSNCVANAAATIAVIVATIIVVAVLAIVTFGGGAMGGAILFASIWQAIIATKIIIAIAIGLTAIALGGVVIGGTYLNAQQAFSSQEDIIRFTPTCDQTISVFEDTTGGSGMCIPEGQVEVTGPEFVKKNGRTRLLKAGELQAVQAITTKCSMGRKLFCQPCTTTCTTTYR